MDNDKIIPFPKKQLSSFITITETKSGGTKITIDWDGISDSHSKGNLILVDTDNKVALETPYKIPKQRFTEKMIGNFTSQIETMYSNLLQNKEINTNEVMPCISLCREVIALSDGLLINYNTDYFNSKWGMDTLILLDIKAVFRRLAIIYEKQKEFQKAIDVCQHAIKLGISNDDMQKRLSRLLKRIQG